MQQKAILQTLVISLVFICSMASAAFAQTTTFTYQGKLSNNSNPASGNYDMQFKLYDALSGGNQISTTITQSTVTVTNGVFTVQLDFAGGAFDGTPRFLEIAVRAADDINDYTALLPRQPITSEPYAVRSANSASADGLSAACFRCVTNNQIDAVDGAKLTGTVAGSQIAGEIPAASVPIGSDNYIQNSAAIQKAGKQAIQQAGGFNINGDGMIGGTLGVGTTTPLSKLAVQTASGNYGLTHTDGTITVATYVGNSASGATGGWFGTVSNHNMYLFTNNGQPKMTIDTAGNVGIGTTTPSAGYKLDVNGQALIRTASGNGGSIAFGTPNSETGMTLSQATGRADIRFDGFGLKLVADLAGGPPSFTNGIIIETGGNVRIGVSQLVTGRLTVDGNSGGSGNVSNGNGIYASGNNFGVRGKSSTGFGVFSEGFLGVNSLGSGGTVALCLNSSSQVATCGSSQRYKTALQAFGEGLSFINQLRPIAFTWKADNLPDVGFGAEDVAQINPLFVTYNTKGEVEGVKYDRLSVVFVNAFKEQQSQIERQNQQIKQQQWQIDALVKLICQQNPQTEICQ